VGDRLASAESAVVSSLEGAEGPWAAVIVCVRWISFCQRFGSFFVVCWVYVMCGASLWLCVGWASWMFVFSGCQETIADQYIQSRFNTLCRPANDLQSEPEIY
jgi:hypothetical protein